MSANAVASTHKFLIHEKGDQVGVVTDPINKDEKVTGVYMDDESKIELQANHDIPLGHKIALKDFEDGEDVIKYGIKIGETSDVINKGDYVHTHNIKTARW